MMNNITAEDWANLQMGLQSLELYTVIVWYFFDVLMPPPQYYDCHLQWLKLHKFAHYEGFLGSDPIQEMKMHKDSPKKL